MRRCPDALVLLPCIGRTGTQREFPVVFRQRTGNAVPAERSASLSHSLLFNFTIFFAFWQLRAWQAAHLV